MPTRTLSVVLPAEMLVRLEKLAKSQKRKMDDLVSEALLQYERQLWWDEMNNKTKSATAKD
jgi:predicted transcriptional regulator